jgi:hypothetical protein
MWKRQRRHDVKRDCGCDSVHGLNNISFQCLDQTEACHYFTAPIGHVEIDPSSWIKAAGCACGENDFVQNITKSRHRRIAQQPAGEVPQADAQQHRTRTEAARRSSIG